MSRNFLAAFWTSSVLDIVERALLLLAFRVQRDIRRIDLKLTRKNLIAWLALASSAFAQNVVTNPTGNQVIAQPNGTSFNANVTNGVLEVDQFAWSSVQAASISAGPNTITLAQCPLGVAGTDTYATKNPHWLYISGSGTPEPVAITGGTCSDGAASKTIWFTAAFAHGAGYTIGTATGGFQEALSYGNRRIAGTYSPIAVDLPKNKEVRLYAPVYIENQTPVTVSGAGGALVNSSYANMIQIGDTFTGKYSGGAGTHVVFENVAVGSAMPKWTVIPSNGAAIVPGTVSETLKVADCPTGFFAAIPNQFLWLNGTYKGLESTYNATGERVRVAGGTCAGSGTGTIVVEQTEPGVTGLSGHDVGYSLSSAVDSAFESNGQGATFNNVTTVNFPGGKTYLGHVFQVDNDQSAIIDGFHPFGYPLRRDSEFVGSYLFSPGPFSLLAGIVAVTKSNFSLQCSGNAVEWYSGNDISLSDTIIQGYVSFGSKISGRRGGFGLEANYRNVYSEIGSCVNPMSPHLGIPDTLDFRYNLTRNGPPISNGLVPWLTLKGQNETVYYVVYRSSVPNYSVPIPIGYANVNDPSANPVDVYWYTGVYDPVPGRGISGFDIIRVSAAGHLPNAPTGVGNYAIAVNIDPAAACNIDGVCHIMDKVAPTALASYQVYEFPGNRNPTWKPYIGRVGTGAVFVAGGSYTGNPTCLITDSTASNTVAFINQANTNPGGGATPCLASGKGIYAPFSVSIGQNSPQISPGIIMPDITGFGGTLGVRGRDNITGIFNFARSTIDSPHHLITFYDSAPDQTEASQGSSSVSARNRRPLQANDAGCGIFDGGYSSSIFCSAGTSISQYIDSSKLGGKDWKTRLTAKDFTFNVGIGQDGAGFKHMRVAGCATSGVQLNACDTTVTWETAFSDASYTATCTGDVIASGVPQLGGLTAKSATAITIRTIALTAAAAKFKTLDCIAVHD